MAASSAASSPRTRSSRSATTLPIEGRAYPIDLNLKVTGIYDGPSTGTCACACCAGNTSTRG